MTAVACLDVGGTAIKAGVLVGEELVAVRQRPTRSASAVGSVVDEVIGHAADLVAELRAEVGALDAVGLVVPGVVDSAGGIAVLSANLGWWDAPLRALLSERVGLPVAFGHDVRAGGLAEARLGAGRSCRDVAFVPIGTGIAAAFVADGVVYDRDRPTGEIGHVDVGHDEPCPCGLTGCLEAVASGSAIRRRYAARTGRDLSAEEVCSRMVAGDPDAGAVWHDAVAGLAHAIAWVAAVLAPEMVVIGGGLARSGDRLLEPLRAELDRRLSFHHRPALTPSIFGELAGCVGAGLLGSDLLHT